jgi:hypothetical protein
MDTSLIDFLSQLPLHALLLIAIIALWRENRRLQAKLEEVRQTTDSVHAMTMKQNDEISALKNGK